MGYNEKECSTLIKEYQRIQVEGCSQALFIRHNRVNKVHLNRNDLTLHLVKKNYMLVPVPAANILFVSVLQLGSVMILSLILL